MKLQFLFCFYLHNFHLRVRCPCESLDAAKCLNGFLKVQDDGPTVLKKKEKRLVLWDGASFFVPEILYFCWKHFLLPRLSLVSFSGIHSFQGFGEAALNLCFGPVFKVESGLPDCAHILRHYSKGQPWRVRLICRVPGVFFFSEVWTVPWETSW